MWTWVTENTLVAAGLAIVVAVACRCLRSHPAVCHFLWLLVLVRLVVPPLHVPSWPPDGLRRTAVRATDGLVRWLHPSDEIAPASGPATEADRARMAKGGRIDSERPLDLTLAGVRDETHPTPSFVDSVSLDSSREWSDSPIAAGRETAAARRERIVPLGFERPSGMSPLTEPRGPIVPAAPTERPKVIQSSVGWVLSQWRDDATWMLLATWLAGSLVVLVWQFARTSAFAQTARIARRAPEQLVRAVADVAERLRIRAPEVRVVRRLGSPVVWSLGRPVLLWPDPRGHALDDDGTRGIVAHELAHLRRRDHWIAWFEMAAMVFMWWHPLFWIARREMRAQAELSCDAWATSLQPDHRRDYAEALLDVVNRMSRKPLVPPALGASDVDFRNFEWRLRMILRQGVSSRVSPLLGTIAFAVAVVVLPSWSGAEAPVKALEFAGTPSPVCSPSRVGTTTKAPCASDDCSTNDCAKCETPDCADVECTPNCSTSIGNVDDAAPVAMQSSQPDDGRDEAKAFERYNAGEFRAAAEAFRAQARNGNSPARALFNAACCLARLGDTNAALDALDEAVKAGWNDGAKIRSDSDLESLHDDSRFDAIAARAERGEDAPEPAKPKKSKAAKVRSAGPAAVGQAARPANDGNDEARGFERYNAGAFHAAAEAFRAQARNGGSPDRALFNVACCLARLGQTDAALQALEEAIRAGWSDADKIRSDADLESLHEDSRFDAIAGSAHRGDEPPKPAKPNKSKPRKTKAVKPAPVDVAPEVDSAVVAAEPTIAGAAPPAEPGAEPRAFEQFKAGDFRAAAEAFRAQAERGESPDRAYYNLACSLTHLGENDAAIDALGRAVDSGWSDADKIRSDDDLAPLRENPHLAIVFEKIDDRRVLAQFGASSWEELRDRSLGEIEENPGDGGAWHHLGWAHLRLDAIDDAIRAFERQEELGFVRKYARYNLACCYAHKGEADRVFEWLAKSLDAGMDDVAHLRDDPDFASLRSDPRFEAFASEMAAAVAERKGAKAKSPKAESSPTNKPKPKPKREEV
ncbi:MAG: tetratricopeptide repeat protein [Planctomycetes bacterium]|nr:tetratricopeptide repeat protein [Planctomycetota bacterium]